MILAALKVAARHQRDAAVPKDFVAAIAYVPGCTASQLFECLGSQLATAPISDADPVNTISPDAVKLFEQAYEEAASLGDRVIGTDHLLLAIAKPGVLSDMKCASYHVLLQKVRKLRSLGVGPDSHKRHAFAARLVRQIKKAFQGAVNLYKLHVQLSAMHPKVVGDPHSIYDRIRNIAPVRRDPILPGWVVTGYAEASAALRDSRFSNEPRSSRTPSATMEIDRLPAGAVRRQLGVIADVLTQMIVFSDPPLHPNLRTQMGQTLSPRAIAAMRERVQAIADELIDAAAPHGRMDLVQDFAYPLPLLVVAEMLGFRRADQARLRRWTEIFDVMISFRTTFEQDLESRRSMIEMRQYFDEIVAELRGTPNASMLSRLIHHPDPVAPIDLDTLFANCVFILAAGHETTASVIGSGMLALLRHPDQLQRLIDDPSLLPNAIEELLRLETPVQWTARRAKEELELGGVKIPRNALVAISLGAANHDPRQFSDPHRLDIARKDANKHLAFSGGNHFCLGAGLGRLELTVAFATLLRRCKNLRVAEGFEAKWRKGHTLRALEHLRITFDVAKPEPVAVGE